MKKNPIKVTVGYIYNKKRSYKVTIFICNEIWIECHAVLKLLNVLCSKSSILLTELATSTQIQFQVLILYALILQNTESWNSAWKVSLKKTCLALSMHCRSTEKIRNIFIMFISSGIEQRFKWFTEKLIKSQC